MITVNHKKALIESATGIEGLIKTGKHNKETVRALMVQKRKEYSLFHITPEMFTIQVLGLLFIERAAKSYLLYPKRKNQANR